MQTTEYTIIRANGDEEVHTIELPAEPDYFQLKAIIEPVIGNNYFEHVAVLHKGERTDMFVDENGLLKGMPRNERATAIYRNNWLTQHPGTEPETLPWIVGPALLFSRRVWF